MARADGGLRKELQKGLPKPAWFWTPIESGGTHQGIPDSYYVHRESGAHGWIECKKTTGWAVKFEPGQVMWLKTRWAAGVPTWVAVRAGGLGSGGGRADALWLYRGCLADVISEGGLKAAEPALRFYGPPSEWDYPRIAQLLISNKTVKPLQSQNQTAQ